MKATAVIFVAIAIAVGVAASAAFAQPQAAGKVRVRIVGANNGKDVTNGGVSGKGKFTATGAVEDEGKVVAYRTVKGDIALGSAVIILRFVTTGKKGTITYRVKIDQSKGTSRWTIVSGTKKYNGLRGAGAEHENADHTIVTLTGSVRR